MNKIPFENGTLVTPAKLNEDNTITPAVYIGTTPLSAHNLNLMQDNIEAEINDSSVIVSSTEPTGEDRKKIWIQKGKNLINLKQKENGHISLENGLIDGYGNWYYFSLKVQSNTSYTFQINPTSTISYEIAYYDENNSFISGDWGDFNSNTKFRTITTPENCQNVKVAWSEDNGYNALMFSQSNIETNYEEYIDKKIYVKNDNDVYEEFVNADEVKNDYSLGERRIGTWIDGKPLYRKVIKTTQSIANGSQVEIAHGINNVNEFTEIKQIFKASWEILYGSSSFLGKNNVEIYVNTNNIIIKNESGADWANCIYTIILEYTKTKM